MAGLVAPHGGASLKPLALTGEALAAEHERAKTLRPVRVSSREKGDLVMLGIGGFTPLEGFMTRADWEGVCEGYRTAGGLFWPIPITLSTDDDSIKAGDEIALTDPESGAPLATMTVSEKYTIDRARECSLVFRTRDGAYPGVAMVMQQPKVNLAGPVKVTSDGGFKAKYGARFLNAPAAGRGGQAPRGGAHKPAA